MFENYLYRAHQSVMARRWAKVRRGLMLSIYFPNGRKLALFEQQGRRYYVSLVKPTEV